MNNSHYILTLKKALRKLQEKNAGIITKLEQTNPLAEMDPEKSTLHDMWHTYQIQTEFKEFIESLLQKQFNTSNTA